MALLSWAVARGRPQAHRFLSLMAEVAARFMYHFAPKHVTMVGEGGVHVPLCTQARHHGG